MTHVTGTDLNDLQFDALATSTASNTQLPSSPIPAINKSLKTTAKTIISAINEVLTTANATNASFTAFSAFYNSILGDANSDVSLKDNMLKVDANVLAAIVKIYKAIYGNDLDNPLAQSSPILQLLLDADTKIVSINQTLPNKLDITASIPVSQVTDLQSFLDAKLNAADSIPMTQVTDLVSSLADKADKTHLHNISDINNLQSILDVLTAGTPSTTDQLPEGAQNLYFTTARVLAFLQSIANSSSSPVFTDATGKVPANLLPISGLYYKGLYDASTNTPPTPDGSPSGEWYKVSVAGTRNGVDLGIGDWLISDGSFWQHVDNTDKVTEVFGRLGDIVAQESDYAAFYASLSGSYANPSWITTIDGSKITGKVDPAVLGTGVASGSTLLFGDGTWKTLAINPGTVERVGLVMPSELSVSISEVTSSGDFVVTWKAQAANQVLSSDSSGVVGFRSLSSDFIPNLDASKITTGTIDSARLPDVDASKITGTISSSVLGTGTADSSTALFGDGSWKPVIKSISIKGDGVIFGDSNALTADGQLTLSPKDGGTGNFLAADGWRKIAATDVPSLDASKTVSGIFDVARLGSGVPTSLTYLRGDGTWGTLPVAGVTSVGLSMPAEFTTGPGVVNAGVLTAAWKAVDAGKFLSGTGTGVAFKAIDAADIPSLDAFKIATGVIDPARLGSGTADSTKVLKGDGTWGTLPPSGVTSVGLIMPSDLIVIGSPITTAGSLSVAWKAVNAGLVFASPASSTDVPSFRALVSSDIPDLDASKISTGIVNPARLGTGTADSTKVLKGDGTWGTLPASGVTSVGLTAPSSLFTVSNTPVISAGDLTLTLNAVAMNKVFIGPESGADSSPSFRLLVLSDIPDLDASKIKTGFVDPVRLGSGTADSTKVLRGDGTWGTLPPSGVTSVGLSLPSMFDVTGSPVTSSGNLSATLAQQAPNTVLAGPASGVGTPSFRTLSEVDIPDLSSTYEKKLGNPASDGLVLVSTAAGVRSWIAQPTFNGVVSVGLSSPVEFVVTGSPVTNTGTLQLAWASQSNAKVLASPVSVSGIPTFRALVASDIPLITAAHIGSGVISPARLASGTPLASTYLRGDGTWSPIAVAGSVTSVDVLMPSTVFQTTSQPVTSTGVISVVFVSQPANSFLAAPNGSDGVPSFRPITAADIPGLSTAFVTSVGLSLPAEFSLTGSPVTSSGSFQATWASQTKNKVLASPDGTDGTPSFRSIVPADLGTGTANSTTFLRGDGSYAVPPIPSALGQVSGASTIPVFAKWTRSAQLSVPASTDTSVTFDTKSADTMLFYVSNKFQPTIAGYYDITFNISLLASSTAVVSILKNNTVVSKSTATGLSASVEDVIYLNGSTDYITFQINCSTASTVTNDTGTYFYAYQVSQPAKPTTAAPASAAVMRYTLTSPMTLLAAAWTVATPKLATFNNILNQQYDPNTGKFAPTTDGYYELSASFSTSVSGTLGIAFSKNGVMYSKMFSAVAGTSIEFKDRLFLIGNTDYVQFYVYSSVANTIVADNQQYFAVCQENQPPSGGLVNDYISLKYIVSANAGATTVGWNVRPLNTKETDSAGICTLNTSTYQFTLQPGTYTVRAEAPSVKSGSNQLGLYNVTAAQYTLTGTTTYVDTASTATPSGIATLVGQFTLLNVATFELRHNVQTANTNGLGVGSVAPYTFGVIEFWRNPKSNTNSVVVCRTKLAVNASYTANTWTTLTFDTVEDDTASYWNTTTKVFSPLKTGYYEVSAAAATDSGIIEIQVMKNSTVVAHWGGGGISASGSCSVSLNGSTDYVFIQVKSTTGKVDVSSYPAYLHITESAAIITTTTPQSLTAIKVGATLSIGAGNAWATIPFNSVDFDAKSEWNTSTYSFTPKVAGYYYVAAQSRTNAASNGVWAVGIIKNGTQVAQGWSGMPSSYSAVSAQTSVILKLTTTDVVKIQYWTNNGDSAADLQTVCSIMSVTGSSNYSTSNNLYTGVSSPQTNQTQVSAVLAHRNGTNLVVTGSTVTLVPMLYVEFDAQGEYNTTTYRFSPKQAGYYNFSFTARLPEGVYNQINVMLYKTGVCVAQCREHSASVSIGATVTANLYLAVGDYVEPKVWTPMTVVSGVNYETYFSAHSVNVGTGTTAPVGMMWPSVTAVRAHLGATNQSVAAATWAKILFTVVEVDSNGEFSTALSRWSPKTAGYYNITLTCSSTATTGVSTAIYKNGVGNTAVGGNSSWGSTASAVMFLTPSDYIEGYGLSTAGVFAASDSGSGGAKVTSLSIYSVNSVALTNNGQGSGSGSGAVSAIGLSMPSTFTVTGSPVTSTGSFNVNWGDVNPSYFLLGPNQASNTAAGQPSFRALTATDLSNAGTPAATSFLAGDLSWKDTRPVYGTIGTSNDADELMAFTADGTTINLVQFTYTYISQGVSIVSNNTQVMLANVTYAADGYYEVSYTCADPNATVILYRGSTEIARGTKSVTTICRMYYTNELSYTNYAGDRLVYPSYGYGISVGIITTNPSISAYWKRSWFTIKSISGISAVNCSVPSNFKPNSVSAHAWTSASVTYTSAQPITFDYRNFNSGSGLVDKPGINPYDGLRYGTWFKPSVPGLYFIQCMMTNGVGGRGIPTWIDVSQNDFKTYSIIALTNDSTTTYISARLTMTGKTAIRIRSQSNYSMLAGCWLLAFLVSSDTTTAIANAVTCDVTCSSNVVVPAATWTPLIMDKLVSSSGMNLGDGTQVSMYDSNTNLVTPKQAGTYMVSAYVPAPSDSVNANYRISVAIRLNGKIIARQAGNSNIGTAINTQVFVNGITDTIDLSVYVVTGDGTTSSTLVASRSDTSERIYMKLSLVTGAIAFQPAGLNNTQDVSYSTGVNFAVGVYRCNAASSSFTLSLPSDPVPDEMHAFKKVDSSFNTITITDSGKLIDGVNSYILSAPGDKVTVRFSGNTWDII